MVHHFVIQHEGDFENLVNFDWLELRILIK